MAKITVPRGIRNNNPGNIRKSTSQWLGKIEGKDEEFETFDTATHGIRALAALLLVYQRKYSLRTVHEIISRWAPGTENNTEMYIKHVCFLTGFLSDQRLTLNSFSTLLKLVKAIIRHENGIMPYSEKQLDEALYAALGV